MGTTIEIQIAREKLPWEIRYASIESLRHLPRCCLSCVSYVDSKCAKGIMPLLGIGYACPRDYSPNPKLSKLRGGKENVA